MFLFAVNVITFDFNRKKPLKLDFRHMRMLKHFSDNIISNMLIEMLKRKPTKAQKYFQSLHVPFI